jgi:hypothetical protein
MIRVFAKDIIEYSAAHRVDLVGYLVSCKTAFFEYFGSRVLCRSIHRMKS